MPERMYVNTSEEVYVRKQDWNGLWAGMFGFLAIWSIFGMLGAAIFASASHGSVAVMERSQTAMGIWAVVLTIIAMFVAGRIAGSHKDQSTAWTVGTVIFGLSVTAALGVAVLSSFIGLGATSAGGAIAAFRSGMMADLGWIGFVALLLGWLGAVAGAMSTVYHGATQTITTETRRAA